jgi:hypothetical protein
VDNEESKMESVLKEADSFFKRLIQRIPESERDWMLSAVCPGTDVGYKPLREIIKNIQAHS